MSIEVGIKRFEGLSQRYILALTTIAFTIILSQIILQHYISQQEKDSVEVNLSGRQRMLSQRISKAAILIITPIHSETVDSYVLELDSSLREWKRAHYGLQFGDPLLGVRGENSIEIQEMFSAIEPHFKEIVNGAETLSQIYKKDQDSVQMLGSIERILQNESSFLEGMDQIVFRYDEEAQRKVAQLKQIEIGLLLLALLLIFLEIRFIFIPSAKFIKNNFRDLKSSESKARQMTMEISSLYESLKKSFQDLAEVEIEVDDFEVFAKCHLDGSFSYFSEKFEGIMEFGEGRPGNFYAWLESQGYTTKFVDKAKAILNQGNTWQGDIKITNEEGDFIWLKLHLVPIYGEAGVLKEMMVVCIDETEVKEAQARSQEIYKEKLDKKLKEQQYRSVLILEGQEEERRRISRDMHDGVGQYLTALKYSIDGIYNVKSAQEKTRLDLSKKLVRDIIKEVRRISFNITPVALSDYGIAPVISKFSKEMSKISEIPVIFENKTDFTSRLEPKVENNLYRIIQEAVNNAIKYSKSSGIIIELSHNAHYLHVEIKDDGQGFDYKKLKERGHFNASGHGIFNIKERVNFINGKFKLETAPGKGTSIQIDLPLDSQLAQSQY